MCVVDISIQLCIILAFVFFFTFCATFNFVDFIVISWNLRFCTCRCWCCMLHVAMHFSYDPWSRRGSCATFFNLPTNPQTCHAAVKQTHLHIYSCVTCRCACFSDFLWIFHATALKMKVNPCCFCVSRCWGEDVWLPHHINCPFHMLNERFEEFLGVYFIYDVLYVLHNLVWAAVLSYKEIYLYFQIIYSFCKISSNKWCSTVF